MHGDNDGSGPEFLLVTITLGGGGHEQRSSESLSKILTLVRRKAGYTYVGALVAVGTQLCKVVNQRYG